MVCQTLVLVHRDPEQANRLGSSYARMEGANRVPSTDPTHVQRCVSLGASGTRALRANASTRRARQESVSQSSSRQRGSKQRADRDQQIVTVRLGPARNHSGRALHYRDAEKGRHI
jgi:hypothetical protein